MLIVVGVISVSTRCRCSWPSPRPSGRPPPSSTASSRTSLSRTTRGNTLCCSSTRWTCEYYATHYYHIFKTVLNLIVGVLPLYLRLKTSSNYVIKRGCHFLGQKHTVASNQIDSWIFFFIQIWSIKKSINIKVTMV